MTRVAIVTAASSGIGAACARELAARGDRVVLLAEPAEIARVVAFLLSPEASHLTGENLRVDGGLLRSL